MTSFIGYLLALCGNFILSLGLTLEKKHVGWIHSKQHGPRRQPEEIAWWGAGFLLTNIQPIFNYFALETLSANVVAALCGSNVAFTMLLSSWLLQEHIDRQKIRWIALMTASLATVGLTQQPSVAVFHALSFWVTFSLPALFALGTFFSLQRKWHISEGLLLGISAGSFSGFMVLAMAALKLTEAAFSLHWLLSPYFYIYFFCGIASLFISQFAFRRGKMSAFAPSYYGVAVLYPSIAAYFVSGIAVVPFQLVGLAGIVVSIVFLEFS